MCIEVYHPDLPVIIRYASETLRFEGPRSIKAWCAFLVQNAGNTPVKSLNALFPRSLYLQDGQGWHFSGVRDLAGEIPNHLENCQPVGGDTLRLMRPDPNRPQFDMPPLEGEWIRDTPPNVPADLFSTSELSLLKKSGFSFFQVDLQSCPIKPWASRWFCWEISVNETGVLCDSPFGQFAVHQMASPCSVRRTVEEHFETVQYSCVAKGYQWVADVCQQLRETLGLTSERRVEIQLLELVIQPGKQFLVGWDVERDLRMRAGSPRQSKGDSDYDPPKGELLYEWKTGTLLGPSRNPWRNEGFTLHLTLACPPA